jgi:hypothetical protein
MGGVRRAIAMRCARPTDSVQPRACPSVRPREDRACDVTPPVSPVTDLGQRAGECQLTALLGERLESSCGVRHAQRSLGKQRAMCMQLLGADGHARPWLSHRNTRNLRQRNRAAEYGAGSISGGIPLIRSATSRPVAAPAVRPTCPCPNACITSAQPDAGPMHGRPSAIEGR